MPPSLPRTAARRAVEERCGDAVPVAGGRSYWTIFRRRNRVLRELPAVRVCLTSTLFALASFTWKAFFGRRETTFDLPGLTLAFATALSAFAFRFPLGFLATTCN